MFLKSLPHFGVHSGILLRLFFSNLLFLVNFKHLNHILNFKVFSHFLIVLFSKNFAYISWVQYILEFLWKYYLKNFFLTLKFLLLLLRGHSVIVGLYFSLTFILQLFLKCLVPFSCPTYFRLAQQKVNWQLCVQEWGLLTLSKISFILEYRKIARIVQRVPIYSTDCFP